MVTPNGICGNSMRDVSAINMAVRHSHSRAQWKPTGNIMIFTCHMKNASPRDRCDSQLRIIACKIWVRSSAKKEDGNDRTGSRPMKRIQEPLHFRTSQAGRVTIGLLPSPLRLAPHAKPQAYLMKHHFQKSKCKVPVHVTFYRSYAITILINLLVPWCIRKCSTRVAASNVTLRFRGLQTTVSLSSPGQPSAHMT